MVKEIWRSAILPVFIDKENDNKIEMLFMRPADPTRGGPEFQIAKGKIEPGETPKQTAIREGEEELGLLDFNIIELIDDGIVLGRTHFFVAIVENKTMFSAPHPEETAEVKWMTKEEYAEIGRQLHVPLVVRAHFLADVYIATKGSKGDNEDA